MKASARNTNETSTDLRSMAETLSRLAASLRDTANRMDRAIPAIRQINVRCGVGTHNAIRDKLKPFAQDAAKKAEAAGA
jgi:hypothetical protein